MEINDSQVDDPQFFQPHNLVSTLMENSRKQFEMYSSKFVEMDNLNVEMGNEIKYLKGKLSNYEQREDDLNDEFDEINSKNEELEHKVNGMIGELRDARETIDQKEEAEKKFHMKKKISDDLIKQLKKENEMLSRKVDDGLKLLEEEYKKNEIKEITDQKYFRSDVMSEDVEDMVKQIEHHEEMNKETKVLIKALSEENKQLKEDLKDLENQNEEVGSTHIKDNNLMSLYEELKMTAGTDNISNFNFAVCGKSFHNKNDNKIHYQSVTQ